MLRSIHCKYLTDTCVLHALSIFAYDTKHILCLVIMYLNPHSAGLASLHRDGVVPWWLKYIIKKVFTIDADLLVNPELTVCTYDVDLMVKNPELIVCTRWGYLQPGQREYLALRCTERLCE